jgi:hypothetical protein
MNFTAQWLREKRALQPSTLDPAPPPSTEDPLFYLDPELHDTPVESAVNTGRKKKKGRRRPKKRADSEDSESDDSDATTHDSSSDTEEEVLPRPTLGRKTSYELQKERNIERNRLMLEEMFGNELDVFQAALGKGVKGKGNAKGKGKGKDIVKGSV